MTGATIKRRKGTASSSATRRTGGSQRRPQRRGGWLDKVVARLPIGAAGLQRLVNWAVALIALVALWLAAQFMGLPAMMGREAALLAGRAGFQVAKVEVRGVERMDEMPVYSLALAEVDRSMLSVDLAELRGRIMTLGWIKDARVTRRLPDTLIVDIVERQPVAVWQQDGALSLVDAEGAVIERIDERAMPDLPLVVGPDANRRIAAMQRLLDAAPALQPLLAGATWVGDRRWDLTFQSGETLLLPEGEAQAAAALAKFARLDGVNRLLGRGIVRFDMRDPERFVLRLPPEHERAAARAQSEPQTDAAPASDAEENATDDEEGAQAGRTLLAGRA